jgi:antitoxin PrlF
VPGQIREPPISLWLIGTVQATFRGSRREGWDFRYPYRGSDVRRTVVDVAAKVTSKGQVTVPKVVRDALGIRDGDEVIFRVEGNRAVLARTPDFLDLAATVSVPAAKRNVAWDEVIRRTRSARAAARR